MGPGPYPSEITRGVKAARKPGPAIASAASSLTARPGARYSLRCAGVMKWQTCQTQNLVRRKLRVGSSPTAGIRVLLTEIG